ncbi:hypothetical protein GCM10023094_39870 [Rhodococcus olei]|uniref:Uncharacterized protein n=1 Tax=Rhodococcus olei TaxID=2161675 RepID=A0ABP8PFA7_9NOCA
MHRPLERTKIKLYCDQPWRHPFTEKIDVLLERATDAVIGAARPGSPQWRQAWESRESAAGRAPSGSGCG